MQAQTNAVKTVNRGTLKRAAQRGELWIKCNYHYTDDYAWDNASGFGKMDEFQKAYLMPEGLDSDAWRETRNAAHGRGEIVVDESDFKNKSGYCYERDGVIRWGIHSNLNYTVQIRKAGR